MFLLGLAKFHPSLLTKMPEARGSLRPGGKSKACVDCGSMVDGNPVNWEHYPVTLYH